MVARAVLLDDLTALFHLDDLLKWIEQCPVALLPLAGDLLGRRSESLSAIGLDRVGWYSRNTRWAPVRAGGTSIDPQR